LRARKQVADEGYVSERYGVRSLHIGSDTIQSSMRITRPNDLELSYTRSMMAFLLFAPAPAKILMIGLGGGSLAKFVHHNLPGAATTVVEINPRVVAIARQSFDVPLDDARLEIVVGDGAEYVERPHVKADVLLVDGYGADAHAEELASERFYGACRRCAAPDGVLVVNLWGSDRQFEVLRRRIYDAFHGAALCLPAERPGNVVVLAFARTRAPYAWEALEARAMGLQAEYGLEFPRFVEALRRTNPPDGTLEVGTR
jgi:spermidine synthase